MRAHFKKIQPPESPSRIRINLSDVETQLGNLARGKVLIYHVGSLPEARKRNRVLSDIARRALALSNSGKIFLLQARVGIRGENKFAYYALGR